MAFRVEFVRGGPDGDHFAVASGTWGDLILLAQAHGWKPEGTTYTPWPTRRHDLEGQVSDYTPDEWLYAKTITTTDARSLAASLRVIAAAAPAGTPPTFVVDGKVLKYNNVYLGTTALQLATYCDGGGFDFAVDD
jgi:hypothetical protein